MKKILNKKLLAIMAIILFAAFIYFSYLVAKEKFVKLDFDTTVKIQDKIPRRLDLPFTFFSILGSVEVTGTIWLMVLIFMLFKKFWFSAAGLFLLPAALAIEVFGKSFVLHPAPPYMFYRGALDVHFPLQFTHTDFSYPSGHETRTAFLVIFLMLYLFYRTPKKVQIVMIPALFGVLVIMTVSRIYLGEHWTTDVVGGFLVGASFALLAGMTIPVSKRKEKEDLVLNDS